MRYGGSEVITAPSTYRPPAALTMPAARILALGDAELKSRKNAPGAMAGAQACATGTSWLAVTADSSSGALRTAAAALSASATPWRAACSRMGPPASVASLMS